MDSSTQTLIAVDHTKLYTRTWEIENPVAVVLMLHGFGEHIHRYEHVAAFFNTHQINVVGMDTRGHGKSEGKRGHAPNYDTLMRDIEQFAAFVKDKFPSLPKILYGHSMGGNLVLNFLLKKEHTFNAAIVTSPWIALQLKLKPFMLLRNQIIRNIIPTVSEDTKLDPSTISTDPEVVKAYASDPFVQGRMTAALGVDVTNAAAFLNKYGGNFPIPLLIVHGDADKLISHDAAQAFAQRVKGDVTFKSFPGMYHETHNEPGKQQVFDAMFAWIKTKI